MRVSIIQETDYVLISGTVEAMKEAFRLREAGYKVLILTEDTFLAPDICAFQCYEVTKEMEQSLPGYVHNKRLLHPDSFKRYLEEECGKAGVKLLYFAFPVAFFEQENDRILLAAAKGGIFGIRCKYVFSFTQVHKPMALRCMVMDDREGEYSLLTARCNTGVEDNMAKALLKLRKGLLESYKEKKRENPGLLLGRFALKGYEPERRWTGADKGAGEDFDFFEPPDSRPMKQLLPEGSRVCAENDFSSFMKYECINIQEEMKLKALKEHFDLAVAGGGTAGAMAALHGARAGLSTVLIEPFYDLGGTQNVGGVTTYWFGNRFSDVLEIDAEIDRIYEEYGIERKEGIWSRYDDFHGGIRGMVLLRLCLEAGVCVRFGELACAAVKKEDTVMGIMTASVTGNRIYLANTVIDGTGDGDIAVFAGAGACYGSRRDCITYWASLAQYQSPAAYQNNFSSMAVCADPFDYTRFILLGRKRGENTFDHGSYVSMRESRHIKGLEEVNLKDFLTFRTWEDGLYTCFSNYDPKGKLDADMIYAGVLPPPIQMQIPLSALIPADKKGKAVKGLYVAGKAVSVTHNAFPGVRMQPDLMHQGAVLGALEAYAQKQGIRMEELDKEDQREFLLQYTDDPLILPEWKPAPEIALDELEADTRTHWMDVPFTYKEKRQNQCLAILCGESDQIRPLLKRRLERETDPVLIRLLTGFALFHGMDDWTEGFCSEIIKELEENRKTGKGLPARRASVMCAQLLPDHGVMPELVYRLNLTGWSRKECILAPFSLVLDILRSSRRDYSDIRKGIYHYIEAFAYAAEHSGLAGFIPMLLELSRLEEFQNLFLEEKQADIMTERYQILLLIIYRALAGLGEKAGYEGLIQFLDGPGMSIQCSACMELRNLTGFDYGLDKALWSRRVNQLKYLPGKVCDKRKF